MPATVPIPSAFLERMESLLGEKFQEFSRALESAPVSGLRVNTLKLSGEEFRRISPFDVGVEIAWAPEAFLLSPNGVPAGSHPFHLAGLYYLQDPSAMAPAALLAVQPGERVLDLAAAPGGKTTFLAARMQGRGVLVANEIKDKRVGHLAMNVERWGAGNVVLTNESPERLADHFGGYFDRVLVDAPCSGEGMFRKDMGARQDWSVEMVEGCAVRQGNILRVAARLVRSGGVLMYSTCTFAPEEDEGVMADFLKAFPQFEPVAMEVYPGFEPGRPEWVEEGGGDARLTKAARLFPHRVSGEGHFVSMLKRAAGEAGRAEGSGWRHGRDTHLTGEQAGWWEGFAVDCLDIHLDEERLRVFGSRLYLVAEDLPDLNGLRVVHPGVWLGTFKTGRFEPAHPLALSLRRGQARRTVNLEVGSRELAAYLRGETLMVDGENGWLVVCVAGWPLGWGKRVQGVVKNHYPRGWLQLKSSGGG